MFICLILFPVISSTPILDNNIDSDLFPDSDLSYLGSTIFGQPNLEIGAKLEQMNNTDNPEEFGEYAEGDILFPKPRTKNGLVALVSHWPKAIVPYEISGSFTGKDREIIEHAISIYHKYTCVKFRPRLPTDDDYISLVSGRSGCWSSVGRIMGRQEVNLQSPSCTTKVGTVMHELMHAIGFLHEQNRWERDDYVTILWQNIKSGHEANFKKADKASTFGYGITYDYRSVMHYSAKAFTINGQPTIIPKDESKKFKIGQRDGFSRGDIKKINAMYNCSNPDPGEEIDKNNNVDVDTENNSNNGLFGVLSFLSNLVNN